ncbi:MAG: hypothetical protein canaca05_06330 [Anaerolineaceae bacterium]
MKKHKTIVFLVILSILFNGVTTGIVSTNAQSPDQEGNNPANSFSILARKGAETIGVTQIEGDLGIAQEETVPIGSWEAGGEIYRGPESLAGTVLNETDAYYELLAEKTCDTTVINEDNTLTTVVLTPGVTCFEGDVVFPEEMLVEADTDESVDYLIRITGSVEFPSFSKVVLTDPKQVEAITWQVEGNITIGEQSQLAGTLLSKADIRLGENAAIVGRLISLEGSIYANENKVTFQVEQGVEPEPVEPTLEPTEEPTAEPTEVPTVEPTQVPTELPTPEPTAEPTQVPTEVPTELPTVEPTSEPTEEPFPEPTKIPTAEPTIEPTVEPTSEPTVELTPEPTPELTEEPTPEQTEEPTPEPTEEPTPELTEEYTPEPTEESTPEPTPEPTLEPEVEPEITISPTPELVPGTDSSILQPMAGEFVPTPLVPNGYIYLKYPTFKWTPVAGASFYNIQIYASSSLVINKIVSASACGTTYCSAVIGPLPYVSLYYWRVRAYDGNWLPWSSFKYFTRLNPIPTLVAPSGTISIPNPQFQWKPIPGATHYNIELYKGSGLYTYMTLTSSACSSTICQVRLSNNLPAGNYSWRVKVYIEGSWNAFSAYKYFTLQQPYPQLIAPTGVISITNPQFKWKPSLGATHYFIELYYQASLYTYMTLTNNACSSVICQVRLSNSLPEGNFYWRVKAYGGGIWGPFSPFMYFTVPPLWGTEIEPNDTSPQYLQHIGLDYYVAAGIQKLGDIDKFSFDAVSGRTYVIELYNLDKVLGTPGSFCSGRSYQTYSGLAIKLFNSSGTQVAWECQAGGNGNVAHSISHTATMTGRYVIQIYPNSTSVTGNYYVRILPKFNEPGAKWDPTTMEPNNSIYNAYQIGIGLNNSFTSAIQWRNPEYYTSSVDQDWYRFYASAGRTYTIQLYNVANILAGGDGVYLTVFDPLMDQIDNKVANGNGNIHSYSVITAGQSGWYYLRVKPDSTTVAGSYRLRILPKYNEPGAAWDSSLESNDHWTNAYPINLGVGNALPTSSYLRDPSFYTIRADTDYFHFPVVQGGVYLVEILNVADTLKDENWGYCNSSFNLIVYDPNMNEVAKDCVGDIEATVYRSITFTAGATGTHYARILSTDQSKYGNYTIRVTRTN